MRRPTLAQVFALSIVALALMLGALFWVLLEGSRRSIIRAADDLRHSVGRRTQTLVERHLSCFAGALALLEGKDGDEPSRVLAERARTLMKDPPEPGWDGVYMAKAK